MIKNWFFLKFAINLEAFRALLWSSKEGILPKLIILIIKLINLLIILVPVLVRVAFITLLERKILGYSQFRLGPNKVRFIGFLQPFSDAAKLLSKEYFRLFTSNIVLFYLSPGISFIIIILLWTASPLVTNIINFKFSFVLLLIVISFTVYPLLLSGWSSNRKYAILGSLRGIAQTISYEISLAFIIISIIIISLRLNISKPEGLPVIIRLFFILPIILLIWLVSCLAETNRTPFDFSEGESELVSGFNVEYGAGGFTLIFLSEYARIYFLRFISVIFFINLDSSNILTHIIVVFLVFFWVWARTTLPRFRYDLLMSLSWKSVLPIRLVFLEGLTIFISL